MEEKFRYLIQFSKQGPLRFIGHLDLMRVFRQLVRRAGLPVAYSQGFNPHQLISFALPLPLGMASINDYAEIFLTGQPGGNEMADRLNTVAPGGLTVKAVKPFPNGPGVAAAAAAADYIWDADVPGAEIAALLRRTEIIIPKKTKSGVKDTDIRRDIIDIKVVSENNRSYCAENAAEARRFQLDSRIVFNRNDHTGGDASVTMRLSAGSQSFLNPLTVAGLFRPGANPGQFTRAEMFKRGQSGALIPLGCVAGV